MLTSPRTLVVALLFFPIVSRVISAQDSSTEVQRGQEYQAGLQKLAQSFAFELGTEDKVLPKLVKQALFSWNNPQRVSDGGVVFLWTLKGRPFATLGIWRMTEPGSRNGYELQSLTQATFSAKSNALGSWLPGKPGLTYASCPDVAPPIADAQRRLRQMRQIAEQHFSATLDPGTPNSEHLRLLSTPLYRYSERPENVIDGAMFAFAQGTDPEVFLILEAREIDGAPIWFYAMAPSTSHGVSGECDKHEVLRTQRTAAPSPANDGAFMFRLWNDSILNSLSPSE